MRDVAALLILGLLTTGGGCARQRDVASDLPPLWGEESPGKLTAAQMMAIVADETHGWANLEGSEPQVQLRLFRVYRAGGYTPKREDIPQLLAGMRNKKLDLPARLGVAHYLLELNVAEARTLVVDEAKGNNSGDAENAVGVLMLSADRCGGDWAIEVMLEVLKGVPRTPKTWTKKEAIELARDDRRLAELRAAHRPGVRKRHDPGRHRQRICDFLESSKPTKAVPVLIEVVRRDPDFDAAVTALCAIDLRAAEPVLLETLLEHYTAEELLAFEPQDAGIPPERRARKMRQWLARIDVAKRSIACVRDSQLWELVELKSRKAVPIIVEHLDCPDLIWALVEIEGKRAIGPLQAHVKRKDAPYRCEAEVALAELQAKDRKELAGALLKLLPKYKHTDQIRLIVSELASCRDARAVEPLLKLLSAEPESPYAWACVEALGQIGDRRAVQPLIKLGRTMKNEADRCNVVRTLGQIGDRRAVGFVAEFGRTGTSECVPDAIGALAGLGGDDAAEAVLGHARKSNDEWTVQRAIEALGRIGGPKAIDGLVELFDQDFSGVGRRTKLGGERADPAELRKAIGAALRHATGKKFGDDSKAWRAWRKGG